MLVPVPNRHLVSETNEEGGDEQHAVDHFDTWFPLLTCQCQLFEALL